MMEKSENKIRNGIFYVVISLIAVLGLASVLYAYSVSNNVNVEGDYNYYEAENQDAPDEVNLGASPGPDIYWDTNIYGALSTGGSSYNATSTAAETYTLVYKDLNYHYIDLMNNKETLTLTFPATSTMFQFLPAIGSTREWWINNATTTVDKTMTFAAGTGMELVGTGATTTETILGEDEWGKVTCFRTYYRAADNVDVTCAIEALDHID